MKEAMKTIFYILLELEALNFGIITGKHMDAGNNVEERDIVVRIWYMQLIIMKAEYLKVMA
jgi:hypothetical protein